MPLGQYENHEFADVANQVSYLLRWRRYKRKSVEVGVFRRGWVTLSADFRGKGASPTNHSWYQSIQSDWPFVWYKNICSASFSFVTIHACDRWTDGQNYDSQDRPRICSRGKNHRIVWKVILAKYWRWIGL